MQQREKRTWAVVEVTICAQDEDMAGWLFMQLGANGCEVVPGNGAGPADAASAADGVEDSAGNAAAPESQLVLRATFDDDKFDEAKVQQINSALDEYGLAKSLASMRTGKLVEEDWLAKWKVGFTPFDVGTGLIITPPWAVPDLDAERRAARHLVIIEPGLAFGTGFHATTRFCLESIEKFLAGENILDVGTGSGILTIAVAKLFPDKTITALETDPIACDVAAENFGLNKVEKNVRLICGSTEALPSAAGANTGSPPYTTILSNLTAEDNVALMPEYTQLLSPGGVIIMSGILTEKAQRVLDAIDAQSLKLVHRFEDGMWTGLVATK